MAASVDLSANGATNWFQVTGPFFIATSGTWTGSAVLQMKDPDGDAVDVADGTFTTNAGAKTVGVEGNGSFRWVFNRTTGSIKVRAWSNHDTINLVAAAP